MERPLIYILKLNKNYKIGITYNIIRRMQQLGIVNTGEIIYQDTFEGGESCERVLHKRFCNKRCHKPPTKNGYTEWFSLDDEDIKNAKKIIADFKRDKLNALLANIGYLGTPNGYREFSRLR